MGLYRCFESANFQNLDALLLKLETTLELRWYFENPPISGHRGEPISWWILDFPTLTSRYQRRVSHFIVICSTLIENDGPDLIMRWCTPLPVAHFQIIQFLLMFVLSVVRKLRRAVSTSIANPKLLEERLRIVIFQHCLCSAWNRNQQIGLKIQHWPRRLHHKRKTTQMVDSWTEFRVSI
jgi:hypothetical protein